MPTIPVTTDSIEYYYDRLTSRQREYEENRLYAIGKNPQIHRMSPQKDPDNRLAIPLAKMAIADMVGYAGSERTIEIDNLETDETAREEEDTDDFIDAVNRVYEFNDTDQLTSQLFKEALIQGVAYEIAFVRREVRLDGIEFVPEYAMVKGNQIVPIFSDDLKPELLAFIWFRSVREGDNDIVIADVYYGRPREDDTTSPLIEVAGTIQRFVKLNDQWMRRDSEDQVHPFSRPPLNIYKINENELSMFEAEKGILFAIDKLLSKSTNEIDRFNASLLVVSGELTDDDLRRIKEWSVIVGRGSSDESDPFYLVRPLQNIESFYASHGDRLERLFHKSIKVPDFSDENFVGNSSGVALSFKLLGMEFLATQIDSFFDMGVRSRYDLIVEALNFGANQRFDVNQYELSIINQRNLPVDNEARARIAQLLVPIVSRETLLRFLPNAVVDDAERELARINEEQGVIGGDIDVDDTQDAPIDDDGTNVDITMGGGDVQQQALNGAQIASIVELASQVSNGLLPRETAVEIVLVAIPGLARPQAEAIFTAITPREPEANGIQ